MNLALYEKGCEPNGSHPFSGETTLEYLRVANPQETSDPRAVEIHHDRAFDIEGGGRLIAVGQTAYMLGGGAVFGDINFQITDTILVQEGPDTPAFRAPGSAVDDDIGIWPGVGSFRFGRRASGCRRRRPGRALGLDLRQDAEQFFVIGLLIDVVYIHIADDALLIDHENGAL